VINKIFSGYCPAHHLAVRFVHYKHISIVGLQFNAFRSSKISSSGFKLIRMFGTNWCLLCSNDIASHAIKFSHILSPTATRCKLKESLTLDVHVQRGLWKLVGVFLPVTAFLVFHATRRQI
jgi:hypothetical protein